MQNIAEALEATIWMYHQRHAQFLEELKRLGALDLYPDWARRGEESRRYLEENPRSSVPEVVVQAN